MREFPGASRGSHKTKEKAIRFICGADAADEPNNYKYDWLRPTLEEIVDAYTKLYGKESRESDIESEGSSAAEEVEEDGEEEEGR